jgi:acyl-CoA oxidase
MLERLYSENQKQMAGGNFNLLADLHASSSGLKSLTSTYASLEINLI